MSSNKVSLSELEKIFKNNDSRSSFTHDYIHFSDDGNGEYYRKFIERNIAGKKYKYQEDAIELSLAAGIFHITYLDAIDKIIYSRRTSWIKLLCLDWLNYFVKQISVDKYAELNLFAKKNHNEFLKLQSTFNLIFLDADIILPEQTVKLLENASIPSIYYRYVNNLNDDRILGTFPKSICKDVLNLISTTSILSESQKGELQLKVAC